MLIRLYTSRVAVFTYILISRHKISHTMLCFPFFWRPFHHLARYSSPYTITIPPLSLVLVFGFTDLTSG
jgi:hypothetical protein